MQVGDWDTLLGRVSTGKCTPFLGAGAVTPALPLGSEIAVRWASEHGYPLEDCHDLARVAQYLAVERDDGMWPKELIAKELGSLTLPDVTAPGEVHAVLARLPLSIYITTNYDDTMCTALRAAGKDPHREICRWNRGAEVEAEPSPLSDGTYIPTPANPLVYHLHGHRELPESLVLTEDDYLDFLVALAREPDLLPHLVTRALAAHSLLFVGYRLADWDFRVVHRGIVSSLAGSLRRLNVTVQLPDPADAQVYWGNSADFAAELAQRWNGNGHH
jgi:hypothetical protein